ncbi:Altered inheritance of mitochondria protein 6-like protein 2 [Fusarium oxysporum f. sp. phaseoli]
MKYSSYFYVKRLAGLGEYRLLPSQRDGDLCQVERCLPQQKQHISRARQKRAGFWPAAVFCTIIIILGNSTYNAAVWSTELSRLVSPVMCHSHNDYWRPHPLFSALAVGCASVEADVWLSPDGEDLLVGHDKRSLSSSRTLRSLYINPLLQILNSMNQPAPHRIFNPTAQTCGVFATEPDKTLILFIDVKDDPVKTWPLVLQQLGPLRDMRYLSRHDKTMATNQTFWPGPITIVGTGNIVKRRDINIGTDLEEWQQRHDAFLDAPLHLLTETGFSQSNGFYGPYELEDEFYTASAPFNKAIGSVRTGFSTQQMETLRNQLQIAKQRNLKSRLWGLPDWPISYRDYVWKILMQEGIDLLNANDVASVAIKYRQLGYPREAA